MATPVTPVLRPRDRSAGTGRARGARCGGRTRLQVSPGGAEVAVTGCDDGDGEDVSRRLEVGCEALLT